MAHEALDAPGGRDESAVGDATAGAAAPAEVALTRPGKAPGFQLVRAGGARSPSGAPGSAPVGREDLATARRQRLDAGVEVHAAARRRRGPHGVRRLPDHVGRRQGVATVPLALAVAATPGVLGEEPR